MIPLWGGQVVFYVNGIFTSKLLYMIPLWGGQGVFLLTIGLCSKASCGCRLQLALTAGRTNPVVGGGQKQHCQSTGQSYLQVQNTKQFLIPNRSLPVGSPYSSNILSSEVAFRCLCDVADIYSKNYACFNVNDWVPSACEQTQSERK